MKYFSLFFLFVLLLFFTACDSPSLLGKKVKKEYFTAGQVRSEFIMDDDTQQNGFLKNYGYTGELMSSVPIHNGVKDGMEIGYDKHERVMWKTPFVNGQEHGEYKAFYPNGDVMVSINYEHGFKEGNAFTYYKDGKVARKVLFRRGKIVN